MVTSSSDHWSLCLGRWRGTEIRLHVLFPIFALIGLLLAIETSFFTAQTLCWALVVLLVSVSLAEFMRVLAAVRLGGHTDAIVIGPISGFTRLRLPDEPQAQIATGLAAPTTFLVSMVLAGCALALAGDENVLRLLNPIDPQVVAKPLVTIDPQANRLGTTSMLLPLIGQLVVWINWTLLLINLLPIEPCAGAELLRGFLWPVVGHPTAHSLTSLIAFGAGVMALLFALVLSKDASDSLIPAWFPLASCALFLFYGGMRPHPRQPVDVGLAIDEFDSDDENWVVSPWDDDDFETVLVEHPQDKQQEALDRKRREREASEDARVDDILARLNSIRFDDLSEEDRTILKRASRRYRRRRSVDDEA